MVGIGYVCAFSPQVSLSLSLSLSLSELTFIFKSIMVIPLTFTHIIRSSGIPESKDCLIVCFVRIGCFVCFV